MFVDPELLPFCATVGTAIDEIREELARHQRRFKPWHQQDAYVGTWDVIPLVSHGIDLKHPPIEAEAASNRRAFPKTMELLEAIPGFVMAGFSLLGPQTSILPHYDSDELDCYRAHLGILVPDGCPLTIEGETRYHRNGDWLVFHGKAHHETHNHSDQNRVTLLVDVLRSMYPVPRLPASEKADTGCGHSRLNSPAAIAPM